MTVRFDRLSDIISVKEGDLVSKSDRFKLFTGPEVGNTPQKGINWLGSSPDYLHVISRCALHSGYLDKCIDASKKNNQKIYSFCDEYIINHSISNKNTLNEIFNTINQLSKLKVKKYILHLYGKSFITKKNEDKIYKNISIISKICKTKKIELLIESNMSPN